MDPYVIFVTIYCTSITIALLLRVCILFAQKYNYNWKKFKLISNIDKTQRESSNESASDYEILFSQLANSLEGICKITKDGNTDKICKKFYAELMERVRNEGNNLYEVLEYESYNTDVREEITNMEPYSEGYAKFINVKKDDSPTQELVYSYADLETTKSFGSINHLKYVEESRDKQEDNSDKSYMAPKQFRPKENCPIELRNLCNIQVEAQTQKPPPLPDKKFSRLENSK